jgi:hypothetical protein
MTHLRPYFLSHHPSAILERIPGVLFRKAKSGDFHERTDQSWIGGVTRREPIPQNWGHFFLARNPFKQKSAIVLKIFHEALITLYKKFKLNVERC